MLKNKSTNQDTQLKTAVLSGASTSALIKARWCEIMRAYAHARVNFRGQRCLSPNQERNLLFCEWSTTGRGYAIIAALHTPTFVRPVSQEILSPGNSVALF